MSGLEGPHSDPGVYAGAGSSQLPIKWSSAGMYSPSEMWPKRGKPQRVQRYVWTEEIEDRLLDLYVENEHLYNMKDPGYSNREKRRRTMAEFSAILDVPIAEVERHLRSLRTQFGRELKELKYGNPHKELSHRKKVLLKRLQFLIPHLRYRKYRSNSSQQDDMDESGVVVKEEDDDDDDDDLDNDVDDVVGDVSILQHIENHYESQPSPVVSDQLYDPHKKLQVVLSDCSSGKMDHHSSSKSPEDLVSPSSPFGSMDDVVMPSTSGVMGTSFPRESERETTPRSLQLLSVSCDSDETDVKPPRPLQFTHNSVSSSSASRGKGLERRRWGTKCARDFSPTKAHSSDELRQQQQQQQGFDVLHSMSQVVTKAIGPEEADEIDFWGEMIVRKVRRIESQETQEDVMMYVSTLITRAIRGHWSPGLEKLEKDLPPAPLAIGPSSEDTPEQQAHQQTLDKKGLEGEDQKDSPSKPTCRRRPWRSDPDYRGKDRIGFKRFHRRKFGMTPAELRAYNAKVVSIRRIRSRRAGSSSLAGPRRTSHPTLTRKRHSEESQDHDIPEDSSSVSSSSEEAQPSRKRVGDLDVTAALMSNVKQEIDTDSEDKEDITLYLTDDSIPNVLRHRGGMEVCLDSVESAVNAEKGGASRVELCANLMEGGTTPSLGMLKTLKKQVSVPVYVMIRPRGGDFMYSDFEYEVMKSDLQHLKEAGADGVVIGILTSDGGVDVRRCQGLIDIARPLPVTFHRAIDMCRDISQAMEDVIILGCERILTSGGESTALEGAPAIASMIEQAGDRTIIVPGGGIHERNLARILEITGAKEFHGSARSAVSSGMTFKKSGISMGASLSPPEFSIKTSDSGKVKDYLIIAQSFWER